MTTVAIRGDGIAALCCEHLLRKAGVPVVMQPNDRPRLPAILLSDSALALIRDVFDRPDLFLERPRIEKRIVAWRPEEPVATVPHSGVVVSEQELLFALRRPDESPLMETTDWTIYCNRPDASQDVHFGKRRTVAAAVSLVPGADLSACWIEALDRGWLFLIPRPDGSGWLLSVGGVVEDLLAQSVCVFRQIGEVTRQAGEFPSHPRILSSLCGADWMACGTAAIAFDPICGDGTANAVREAILAAAVVTGIHRGEDAGGLLRHYETRLILGMQRHLVLCRDFYTSGPRGAWWQEELTALRQGFDWCVQHVGTRPEFHYQLNGFELERRC